MGRRFSKLIPYISYDNRSQLKQASGSTGELREVEDLGIFMFVSGLVEPDDDETCFATTSGAWILQSPSVDVVDSIVRPELEEVQNDVSVLQNQIQRVTSEQNGILQQLLTKTVVLFDSERDLAQGATNVTTLQLMWRDIGILDPSKIVAIEMMPVTLATTGNAIFYTYFLNEYGNTITHQMISSYSGYNPNIGRIDGGPAFNGGFYFPMYSGTASAGYSYGSGVTGHIIWNPKVFNDYATSQNYYGQTIAGYVGYQQSTSYQYPNIENFVWDNNGTNVLSERSMGFRFVASSGVFRQGSLTVRITYRP